MHYNPEHDTRILTLYQPWASLMAWGDKKFETRPRNTSWRRYRGWVAIHSSVNLGAAMHADVQSETPFTRALEANDCPKTEDHDLAPWLLPTGKILALLRFECAYESHEARDFVTAKELYLGDYGPGRIAIKTTDLRRLPRPIEWKGAQGLRRAPDALRAEIAKQLQEAAE